MPDGAATSVTGRTWPQGLTRVPFWVYQDPGILRAEQQRLFEGPVWNFLCLEAEIANLGEAYTGTAHWLKQQVASLG